jgi:anthranilate phosphoribosyltransferase
MLADLATSVAEGADLARSALKSGAAAKTLARLIESEDA